MCPKILYVGHHLTHCINPYIYNTQVIICHHYFIFIVNKISEHLLFKVERKPPSHVLLFPYYGHASLNSGTLNENSEL